MPPNNPSAYKSPYEKRTTSEKIAGAIDDTFRSLTGKETEAQQIARAQARAQCLASGGTWDDKTNTCNLPPQPTAKPSATPTTKGGSYDAAKGGYTDASGKFYPTQDPSFKPTATPSRETQFLPNGDVVVTIGDVQRTLTAQEYDRILGGAGTGSQNVRDIENAPSVIQQAQIRRQERLQQLTQLAQQGLLTPEELQAIQGADFNYGQAAGAGLANIAPSLLGGSGLGSAGAGATAGFALGGPVGAAVGGVIGAAVGGFLSGVRSDLKSQTSGEFSADQTALTKGQAYLKFLVSDTKKNPQNAEQNIILFYKTLDNIDTAHAKTFRDSQENLNKFLGNDGTEQLAKFATFNDYARQRYITEFEIALTSPGQALNDLGLEDLEDLGFENE